VGISVAVGVLLALGFVVRLQLQTNSAFQSLAQVAQVAEVRDFVIRGKKINTDGWFIRIADSEFGDRELRALVPHLMKAPVLWLDLSDTRVTDAGLGALRPVSFIPILILRGASVTKACFEDVEGLNVRHLDLRGTRIRGADLDPARLFMLESL
jgi:hypothetical protein